MIIGNCSSCFSVNRYSKSSDSDNVQSQNKFYGIKCASTSNKRSTHCITDINQAECTVCNSQHSLNRSIRKWLALLPHKFKGSLCFWCFRKITKQTTDSINEPDKKFIQKYWYCLSCLESSVVAFFEYVQGQFIHSLVYFGYIKSQFGF